LHGGRHGIAGCAKTTNPMVRRAYQREQDEVDGLKRRYGELTNAIPQAPPNIEPRVVFEARKRKAAQQQQLPPPKNTRGASTSVQDSRIAKLVNVQARKKMILEWLGASIHVVSHSMLFALLTGKI